MSTLYSVVTGYRDMDRAGVGALEADRAFAAAERIGTCCAIYEGTAADGKCVRTANGSGDACSSVEAIEQFEWELQQSLYGEVQS